MTYFEVSPDGPWLVNVAFADEPGLFQRDGDNQLVLSAEVREWIEVNHPEAFVNEVKAAATLIFYDRAVQTYFRLRF